MAIIQHACRGRQEWQDRPAHLFSEPRHSPGPRAPRRAWQGTPMCSAELHLLAWTRGGRPEIPPLAQALLPQSRCAHRVPRALPLVPYLLVGPRGAELTHAEPCPVQAVCSDTASLEDRPLLGVRPRPGLHGTEQVRRPAACTCPPRPCLGPTHSGRGRPRSLWSHGRCPCSSSPRAGAPASCRAGCA